MFSSNIDAVSWTLEAFRRLFHACAGRAVELFSYTSSTAVRAALLAAGFYVAKGCATGERPESTIAFTPEAHRSATTARHELLAADWLARWTRSQAKFPATLPPEEHTAFEQAIRAHPQF
jgi:queuine tRNA-ribosyltransferase